MSVCICLSVCLSVYVYVSVRMCVYCVRPRQLIDLINNRDDNNADNNCDVHYSHKKRHQKINFTSKIQCRNNHL